MGQELINIGNEANDGTGDPGRIAFDKVNNNFTELYNAEATVKYTQITTSSRAITDEELIIGTNIFGVIYSGATVQLPVNIDSTKIIIINDETGTAGTNNIVISVSEVIPPTDFTVVSYTDTTATLSWTPPERGTIVGYLIYANGVSTINTPYEVGSSIVMGGLITGKTYTLYMTSYDDNFISSPSNEVTITTL